MLTPCRSRRRVPFRLETLESRSLMCSTDLFFAYQAAILAQTGGQTSPVTELLTVTPAPAAPDQAFAAPEPPPSLTSQAMAAPTVPVTPSVPAAQGPQPVTGDLISVSGRVFKDIDRDGVRDAGEAGLKGVRVYLDLNSNGRWNINEPSRRTDASGVYTFTGIKPGTYTVREVLPPGWRTSPPASRGLVVTPDLGPAVTGTDFGNYKATPAMTSRLGITTGDARTPILIPPPGAVMGMAFGPAAPADQQATDTQV